MADVSSREGWVLDLAPGRRVGDYEVVSLLGASYDVRGDRFLVLAARSARSQPLSLLLDWTALAR